MSPSGVEKSWDQTETKFGLKMNIVYSPRRRWLALHIEDIS